MSHAPIRKIAAKSASSSRQICATWEPGPQERIEMVQVAAYYIAERDGFKGVASDYWAAAEFHVSQMLALQTTQEKLQIIIDTALDAAVLMDARGCIISWSRQAEVLFGWLSEEALGRALHETIIPLRYREAHQQGMARFLKTGEARLLNCRFEAYALHRDGHEFPIELSVVPIKTDTGYEFSAFLRDVSERKQMEQAIQESELRYRTVANFTSDWEYWVLPDGTLRYMSPSCEELSGYSTDEFYANPKLLWQIIHPEDQHLFINHTHKLSPRGLVEPIDFRIQTKQGEWRWISHVCRPVFDADAKPLGERASNRDITDRKKIEDQVRQLAFYDTLTLLPNRRLLSDRLSQTMAASKRSGCYCALMFLDLDNFKPLNDAHGHEAGDLLLIEVAARLKRGMREMDTVARFGGDEFVVILGELAQDRAASVDQARNIAEKLRLALAEPFVLTLQREGQGDTTVQHHCTASIGVAMFVDHEASQDDILKWADDAMYQAKESGRNCVRIHGATSGGADAAGNSA